MDGYSEEKLTIMQSDMPGSASTSNLNISLTIENGVVSLSLNRDGNYKSEVVLMEYKYYKSFQEVEGQRSGPYIFRPSEADEIPTSYNNFTNYEVFNGKVVQQFILYGDQIDTVISINKFTDYVEIYTYLQGIPLSSQGQEVIIHFTFDQIVNNKTFYTDSMGLEMQKKDCRL